MNSGKVFELTNCIDKLNHYKSVHLFFYSVQNKQLKLLLTKDTLHESGHNGYSEIRDEVKLIDGTASIAISRLLATKYRGLFSDKNVEKMSKCQELTKDDFVFKNELYNIHDNKNYYEWALKIAKNPIQYDKFDGMMMYFIELPMLDLTYLNNNLESLNLEHSFIYFDYDYNKSDADTNNVDKNTLNLMSSFDFNAHIQESKRRVEENLNDHFVILQCHTHSLKEQDDNTYYLFPALFTGLFRKNQENWSYHIAADNDFPDHDTLSKTKALIMPGSLLHIYEPGYPHFKKVQEFLKRILTDYPKIKILGICFGHQMFSETNGGLVLKRKGGESFSGVEEINIDDSFWDFNFVRNSGVQRKKVVNLFQSHLDEVVEMPKNLNRYADSETCENEIFASPDERVFTLQGHPEYTPEFFFFRHFKSKFQKNGLDFTEENYNNLKEKIVSYYKKKGEVGFELRSICYSFLKSN